MRLRRAWSSLLLACQLKLTDSDGLAAVVSNLERHITSHVFMKTVPLPHIHHAASTSSDHPILAHSTYREHGKAIDPRAVTKSCSHPSSPGLVLTLVGHFSTMVWVCLILNLLTLPCMWNCLARANL